MKLCRLMLALQLVASSAVGQFNGSPQKGTGHVPAGAERPPDALVRELYREVVARHPVGIPGDADMKIFALYLSKALLHRIDLAIACSADEARQHPDPNLKPEIAWLESGLFSGDDERTSPRAFHIERTQREKNGSFRVYVRLTWGSPPKNPSKCHSITTFSWVLNLVDLGATAISLDGRVTRRATRTRFWPKSSIAESSMFMLVLACFGQKMTICSLLYASLCGLGFLEQLVGLASSSGSGLEDRGHNR